MRSEISTDVLAWLRGFSTEALDEKLLLGATELERAHLAAPGGEGARHGLELVDDRLLPIGVWPWFTNCPRPPEEVESLGSVWAATDPDVALAAPMPPWWPAAANERWAPPSRHLQKRDRC